MIVYGERLRPWLEAKLDMDLPQDSQFLGLAINGQPKAAVGFAHWTGEDIELNVAAECGTPGFVGCVFAYVFGQLQCVRCTAHIRADNAASQKLVKRLGFVEEGRLRKARGGHDVLIFGLLKEELRYGIKSKAAETH